MHLGLWQLGAHRASAARLEGAAPAGRCTHLHWLRWLHWVRRQQVWWEAGHGGRMAKCPEPEKYRKRGISFLLHVM